MSQLSKKPSLSIVIPAYNESKRIEKTLLATAKYFQRRRLSYEIIVVNDGSTDDTVKLVQKIKRVNRMPLVLIKNEKNYGKGFSIKQGVNCAKGDWILFMDADLATPIKEFNKLWIDKKPESIIIGSRHIRGSVVVARNNIFRQLASYLGRVMVNILLLPEISDTQCGFKLFSNACAKELFNRQTINRFGFDIEILTLAKTIGYEIKEVPIEWHDQPFSKVSIFKDSWKVFFEVLSIKYKITQSQLLNSSYTKKIAIAE